MTSRFFSSPPSIFPPPRKMSNMPVAVPFIRVQADSSFAVDDAGIALLESLTRKVAVISIAGRYRSGKSFLLNQLSGAVGAFGIGDTVESHTRGLWLLHTGLVATSPEGYEVDVVFLDSEGLGATDRVRLSLAHFSQRTSWFSYF